jgi:predicted nuclease of predicted toxin-antitoxin system
MAKLKYLADMNISPLTVSVLCHKGYDVLRVNAVLSPSVTDEQILLHSREREYVVITEDMDFSALLALSGYGRPSVVSLRLSFSDPESVADRLIHVLPLCEKSLEEGCVVSVSDEAIRMRRLPIG